MDTKKLVTKNEFTLTDVPAITTRAADVER